MLLCSPFVIVFVTVPLLLLLSMSAPCIMSSWPRPATKHITVYHYQDQIDDTSPSPGRGWGIDLKLCKSTSNDPPVLTVSKFHVQHLASSLLERQSCMKTSGAMSSLPKPVHVRCLVIITVAVVYVDTHIPYCVLAICYLLIRYI